ncbi:acyltransferase [candidate division WOR-3 bacterium]|uniref:Acyltransferase n=1 Tax=candidate division WOR-3 bacterium TaxID=2052148 RepID=A0A9D5K819_UNCW3|nr:acyltransferase [candidate division WOR-3 bacterium]MBD3364128.1 acyltransferase [candidate division WOR-3 bacterium]
MKVGVLQFTPVLKDIRTNYQKIEKLTEGADLDLLVLPELCTTGYLYKSTEELMPLAEEFPGDKSSAFFTRLASNIGGHVVAGVAEISNKEIYNSAVLFNANGHVATYRKIHLFDREKEIFTPGNLGFPVFDIGAARIGMMVCFDWIFPESARSLALAGADIICHPANLVLPYCPRAAVTRAIENRVFYLLADRVGSERRIDAELTFIGQSKILDPGGNILAFLGTDEALITAEIDPAQARDKFVTPRNDILTDRRPEFYR